MKPISAKLLNKEAKEDIADKIRSGKITSDQFKKMLDESDTKVRIAVNEYFRGLFKIKL